MRQGSEAKWGPFILGSPLVIGGWGGGRYVKSFTHQHTYQIGTHASRGARLGCGDAEMEEMGPWGSHSKMVIDRDK